MTCIKHEDPRCLTTKLTKSTGAESILRSW